MGSFLRDATEVKDRLLKFLEEEGCKLAPLLPEQTDAIVWEELPDKRDRLDRARDIGFRERVREQRHLENKQLAAEKADREALERELRRAQEAVEVWKSQRAPVPGAIAKLLRDLRR